MAGLFLWVSCQLVFLSLFGSVNLFPCSFMTLEVNKKGSL